MLAVYLYYHANLVQSVSPHALYTLWVGPVIRAISLYSYFEKGCRKKMCTRQSRKVTWDMINTLFLTL